MNSRSQKLGFLLLALTLTVGLIVPSALAKGKTFTGTVSDAMCGVKHIFSSAEGNSVGQRHGSQADFLYQGSGKTPRAVNFIRAGIARRRNRRPEPGAGLFHLPSQLQAAGP